MAETFITYNEIIALMKLWGKIQSQSKSIEIDFVLCNEFSKSGQDQAQFGVSKICYEKWLADARFSETNLGNQDKTFSVWVAVYTCMFVSMHACVFLCT